MPDSREAHRPALDVPGLALSILMLGSLVYTIIEAPSRGWTSTATLTGFAVAAASTALFVIVELRRTDPLIDVSLFANLRFSAASGAVTVAFFALFGFIFLITLFFQLVQGQTPLHDRRAGRAGGGLDRRRLGPRDPPRRDADRDQGSRHARGC